MLKTFKKRNISLVIGCIYQDLNELKNLFKKLYNNLDYLGEIICVVSGVDTPDKENKLLELNDLVKVNIKIISLDQIVMPGRSRNIGILKSKFDYICFLDAHPVPHKNWLLNSIKLLEKKELRGVLGRCNYIGINEFEKCFISATYGNKPLFTVPGTLIEKNLLNEIGHFIPNYRSGEDSEWLNRSKSFNHKLKQMKVIPLVYKGLKGRNIFQLCNKWYIYYKSTYLDPKFNFQKTLYLSSISTLLILLAFSWNDKVANWDQNSLLYAPHISKIVISLIIGIYLLCRLFLIPRKKNVNIFKFNLVQFLKFSFISVLLDFIKFIAFIKHRK